MGFYDLSCAVTGLSLKGQRCDVLLLRRARGRLEPVWGAITGSYNRLGTIDDPKGSREELAHLHGAYDEHVASGRLIHEGDALAIGEPFFERFEANRHRVRIDGEELLLSLVHHRVLEHLAKAHGPSESMRDDALFSRSFPEGRSFAPFAPVSGLRRGLSRLHALRAWLGARPIPLPRAAAQHTNEDVQRSIRDAKKRAPALRAPALREAIDEAEALDYAGLR